jgi:hypothetical protein
MGPPLRVFGAATNRVINPTFGYDAKRQRDGDPEQGTLACDAENQLSNLSFGSGISTVHYRASNLQRRSFRHVFQN